MHILCLNIVKCYNFEDKISSPKYGHSNGPVECRGRLLKKCYVDGKKRFLVLLDYRNTPI